MPRRLLIVATVTAAIAALGLELATRWLASHPGPSPQPVHRLGRSGDEPLPRLWAVPRFSLVDQDGRTRTADELRGSVWIADFIFTHCTSVCPVLTARMVQVQRAVGDPRLRFVSFSVDPGRDSPEALREYARRWAPDETRWMLLSTTQESLAAVAAGMKTFVEPQPDPNATLHTSEFFLVDAEGRVRGLYDTDGDSFAQLVPDARRLLAELHRTSPPGTAAAASTAADGAALYGRMGCPGCHDVPSIAPSLAGIAGRTVMLADGRTVSADAAYIRESILEPAAKVVASYPPSMPSYRTQLAEAELTRLVEYVQGLPAAPGRTASRTVAGEGPAIDPVCGMQVHPGPETPHLSDQGHTVYFCSDSCRERYAAHPGQFRR